MKYLIVSEKHWHKKLVHDLSDTIGYEWVLIDSKDEFTISNVEILKPAKIFIPHWSYIIPSVIYERYECIVFHMTDLPLGRGGSPLQNLIVRGLKTTKITAIKVTGELDAGPVFLKEDLSLEGSAQKIFERSVPVIKNMICKIISENLIPIAQSGVPTFFKRRSREESNMNCLSELHEVYDYIRMLDAEGYPTAFFENVNFRIEFTEPVIGQKHIVAYARIFKK